MLKRATLILVILSLILILSPAIGASDHPQNVILFGWDGLNRDVVKKYLEQKKLPNLQKLIDEGTFVEIDVEGKADTKAGWAQILSGYYPEVTGVYSNYQYKPIPEDLSIFERLEKHFGPDKFVSVAIIGQSEDFGTAPPKKVRVQDEKRSSQSDKTVETEKAANKRQPQGTFWLENGRRYRIIPGQPYYFTTRSMDLFENGLEVNEKVSARVIEILEKYKDKPFFFFVNFTDAVNAARKHKENSKEYKEALLSNDLWTGRIMAKIRDLGLGDKTQFYITAAHGSNYDEKEQSFSSDVFLAANNKKINRNGRRQDLAPTILEAFGLNLNELKPALDGISLTKTDNRPPLKDQTESRKPDVPYVTTPQEVVDKMLELAKVKKDSLLYDLGCGDGRFVVTAAKRFGCKAVGYDISPRRVRESRQNVKKNNLEHLVQIEQKDIFTLDLSKADVITLFLLPSLNVKLIPQLDKLKPGSRIVSYNFGMRGVIPDRTIRFTSPKDKSKHTIYLWTTPLKKVWMMKNNPPNTIPNRR
jgi:precorrin-6B methylase 2